MTRPILPMFCRIISPSPGQSHDCPSASEPLSQILANNSYHSADNNDIVKNKTQHYKNNQRCNCWSLGMDKSFYLTLNQACDLLGLTCLPLVPRICISQSGMHWFRWCLLAYSAPSHYLNQLDDPGQTPVIFPQIQTFSFKKLHLKIACAKWSPFMSMVCVCVFLCVRVCV